MRRHRVVMVLAAVCCAAPLTATAALASRVAAQAGTWGTAIEVPGLGSLNQGGLAEVRSVSCPTAGNCAAGGSYVDGSGRFRAFVLRETRGTWAKAKDVPGVGTLAAGGSTVVYSVSCATAGNCAAIGQAPGFVVSKANGTWGNALKVPGLGALTPNQAVGPYWVSCASAGNCAAVGGYLNVSFRQELFLLSEKNGIWGNALKVPGLAVMNQGGLALAGSVSCATAGNCAVGGTYMDGSGHPQAFVASQVNGTWRKAIEVPGSGVLNAGGSARVTSVSCPSAGNCVAGGNYHDSAGNLQAFVVREVNGTWRAAFKVPGLSAANAGGFASIDSVSCATAGNCTAAGYYTKNTVGRTQAFVTGETNGTWGTLRAVTLAPGTTDPFPIASHASVSCATAGNCTVGVTYGDDHGLQHPFVASQTGGTWGAAIEIPGLASLNAGRNASIDSVSCGATGNCAAVGIYTDGSGHTQAFVASQA